MRRLRGEQFCSIEHMDQYAAQQAEFALERLAQAADERPATSRPPLLRRMQKWQDTAVMDGEPDSAPIVEEQAAPADTPDHEYPMASFVEQALMAAREPDQEPSSNGFAPTEAWGKVATNWAIPVFESKPEDPRTWNAGKLVSQVPPLAHLRLLLELQAPESAEAEAHVSTEPESFGAFAQLPELDEEVEQVKENWNEDRVLAPASPRFASPLDAAPQVLVKTADSVDGAVEIADTAPLAAGIATQRPDRVGPRYEGLRSRSTEFTIQTMDGPRFLVPGLLPDLHVPLARASMLPLLSDWRASEPQMLSVSPADLAAAQPRAPMLRAWPPIPAWNLPQSFEAGKVPIPAWTLQPALSAIMRTSDGQWQSFPGQVRTPAVPPTGARFGRTGASYGWEGAALRTSQAQPLSSELPADATLAARLAAIERLGVQPGFDASSLVAAPRPNPKPFTSDLQSLDSAGSVDPRGQAPRLRDFRARVGVQLEILGRRGAEAWSEPRMDASTIEPSLDVTLRPSIASVGAECPLFRLDAPVLARSGGSISNPVIASGAVPEPLAAEEANWAGYPARWPKLAAPFAAVPVHVPVTLEPRTEAVQGKVLTAGPVRYSPVALVVIPLPEFRMIAPVPPPEQRFAAQATRNTPTLPRVRHTGYRSFGPFPKLPAKMPGLPFEMRVPLFQAPMFDVPYEWRSIADDRTGLPQFPAATEVRLHPAHYWAWPSPKAPRATRALPEWFQELQASQSAPESAPVRRFGPGTAPGLQGLGRNADGLPKAGA
jgi:hypothetical protein